MEGLPVSIVYLEIPFSMFKTICFASFLKHFLSLCFISTAIHRMILHNESMWSMSPANGFKSYADSWSGESI
jgi:hypothetical protein